MRHLKHFLLLILLLCSVTASASAEADHDFKCGNCYYVISSNTTVDVFEAPNFYRGNIYIPEKVSDQDHPDKVYSVTGIFSSAFEQCYELTSVRIGSLVQYIGADAFKYCSKLTSITIPNSVIYILPEAFYGCTGLTNLSLGSGLTSIGNCAFQECSGLTKITIPNSVSKIGDKAFYKNTSLKEVNLGTSLTTIGNLAFAYCKLTSIHIPQSVTNIGDETFYGCSKLDTVYCYASNVPSGESPFINCNTENATLYVPLSAINAYKANSNWNKFKNIIAYDGIQAKSVTLNKTSVTLNSDETVTLTATVLPENATDKTVTWASSNNAVATVVNGKVTAVAPGNATITVKTADGTNLTATCAVTVNSSAPTGQNYLTYSIIGENQVEVSGLTDEAKKLTSLVLNIPSTTTIDGKTYSVTKIGDLSFYYDINISSVTIPNSITTIGRYAFYGCNISSIKLPSSIIEIDNFAFGECQNLTGITIPNSVNIIQFGVFAGCTELSSIVVESGNTTYDSRNNCNAIINTRSNTLIQGCKNTIIPNTVTTIDYDAFGGCSGLINITIPNSVTSIKEDSFYGCGLTNITIPNSVTSIDENPFRGCSQLVNIKVETENPVYDSRENCNAIINTYTNTLTSGCKETKIPNTVSSIGNYAFCGCEDLTNITIPNSVATIGNYAFAFCYGLSDVVIPNFVTCIGYSSFEGCSNLTSITLPSSITSIGDYAFNWTGLVSIYSNIKNPPVINSSVFDDDIYTTATLYVPNGCVSTYQNTQSWNQFKKIEENNTPILAESISLNQNSISLDVNSNIILLATILPSNTTNKTVTWTSSNNEIATVVNGRVTGIAPGDATITVKTTDGSNLTATCKVTVTEPEPEYVTGDANGDGFVRINDVVTTSNYILGDEPAGFVFAAADVNQDGFVRINDVVLIANIILDGGMNAPAKVAAMQLAGNDYMTAQGVEIKAGETRFIDIELNNDNAFSALQMDINLPDGLMLKGATLTGRADGHNLMTGRTVNGKATIAVFSTESNNFAGNNGAVIRLEVMATGNVTGDITLDNIYASTARGVLKQLDAVSVGVNDVSSINDITVGNGLVNVYNTAGQLVRRNANASEATRNLPAGLYLVGGKKVVVK